MSITVALLAFIAAGSILIVTPGPDTALVLRTAAVEGPRRGAYTSIGICVGLLLWGLAAALGISAVLAASHSAFTVLRTIGAAWLVWLGANLIVRSRRIVGKGGAVSPGMEATRRGSGGGSSPT